jgi:uncharacterized protein (DUF1684 family)
MIPRNILRISAAVAVATLSSTAIGGLAAPALAGDWRADLDAWKQDRDAKLRRPDGWLTLIGLAWLSAGENAVGAAPDAAVRLPADRSPELIGRIFVDAERLRFDARKGAEVTADGRPVTSIELRTDLADEGPTVLRYGSLSFYVIERSNRLAVRIKDAQAEALERFAGLEYYPVDARWRVPARFEPAPPGTTYAVPNVLGWVEEMNQPGWVEFDLDGATHRLIALDDTGDGRLFLVFGDRTNGRETYGGGRFLYTDPPVDGATTVDFNRAYNPPCVFTPYATCPLPPPGNKLPLRIEAGEKKYAAAVH